MTVLSGLNVRLASLYGSVIRSDLLHAVEHLEQPRVELPLPTDSAEHRSQRARRPVHVETHARSAAR